MKYSLSAIAWILTTFSMYLLCSGAVSIIGGHSYREVLCSQGQIVGFIFIYWWLPSAFVAQEVYDWLDNNL